MAFASLAARGACAAQYQRVTEPRPAGSVFCHVLLALATPISLAWATSISLAFVGQAPCLRRPLRPPTACRDKPLPAGPQHHFRRIQSEFGPGPLPHHLSRRPDERMLHDEAVWETAAGRVPAPQGPVCLGTQCCFTTQRCFTTQCCLSTQRYLATQRRFATQRPILSRL